jgi:2-haloacid dehalogenase
MISMLSGTPRPSWITFDCYGTLIQWDEGLLEAVRSILARKGKSIDPQRFIDIYDRREHALEQTPPHRIFSEVAGSALRLAMQDLGVASDERDAASLTEAIGAMPPFPEVVATLRELKRAGFGLCIVSNTDDAIIAGNVAQLGGCIDRVVTAEQAGAYKPSRRIFEFARRALGVKSDEVVHVCASPHLDLVATRELGIRDVWIDRGTGRRPADGYMPAATLPSLEGLPGLFREAGWI